MRLVLDGLLAVERADEARPAGDAGQAVDERPVAELDREVRAGRAGARPRIPGRCRRDHGTSSLSASSSAGTRARMPAASSGPVGVAMQLLVRGFADARARAHGGLADQGVERPRRRAPPRARARSVERALDVRELRLQPGERLAEDAQRFEAAARRPRRSRPAGGSTRSPPACAGRCGRAGRCAARRATGFHGRSNSTSRRQNSKLRPSPPALGGDEQARTFGLAEPRDLGVAPRGGQLLVEDAGRELRAVAERRAQHLQRLAVRHEDERLLVRPPPARRLAQQPVEARVGGVHRVGLRLQRAFVGRRAPRPAPLPTPARGGCGRSSARRATASGAGAPRSAASTARRRASRPRSRRDRECPPAAAGRRCRRGAWSWCTAAAASARARRASKLASSGNSSGRRSCSRRKNPWASSSSGVALRSRTWRPRPAIGATARQARLAGVAGRAPQAMRFVHHQQIDARFHRLLGQLRALDQRLQRDHRPPMHVERVEVGAEVARHVGEPVARRAA